MEGTMAAPNFNVILKLLPHQTENDRPQHLYFCEKTFSDMLTFRGKLSSLFLPLVGCYDKTTILWLD